MADGNMSYDIEVRPIYRRPSPHQIDFSGVQQFTNLKELDSEWDDDDIDVSNCVNKLHIYLLNR